MIYFLAGIAAAIFAFLSLRFSIFIPPTRGLPVLVYHKVSMTHADNLTIRPETFEQHLNFLAQNGYTAISLKELIAFHEKRANLPKKPVMITFDDGYVNNFELAYPLLKKHACKAVFFIPTAGIGKTNWWDRDQEPLMNADQLLALDSGLVELGLHSTDHRHYGKLRPDQIEADMRESIDTLRKLSVGFAPAFSYPYGGRPKDKATYASMLETFASIGIKIAFRLGNRVNKLPLRNCFEVKRISIRGTDSMWTFKTKITKGRVKQA